MLNAFSFGSNYRSQTFKILEDFDFVNIKHSGFKFKEYLILNEQFSHLFFYNKNF